jgi:signal peptidase
MTFLLLVTLTLAAGVAVLAFGARTWTSADGSRAVLRRAGNVLAGVLVLVVVALAAIPAYGHLTGDYRILPVLSGSMEPVMARGDAAWVTSKPLDELEAGDVLVFDPPTEEMQGRTTIHRVIELVPEDTIAPTDRREGAVYVRTQGDNNEDADPWVAAVTDERVWVHERTVPQVGTLLTAAGGGNARLLGMFVAAALIAAWGVRTITAQETKDEVAQRLARRAQGEAWLKVASGETTGPAGTITLDVPEVPRTGPPAAGREAARKVSKPVAVVMTAVAIVLGGAMFASSASVFDSEELQATLDSSVVGSPSRPANRRSTCRSTSCSPATAPSS